MEKQERRSLRLPDGMEFVMEDGMVCKVRSVFLGEREMGELLNDLELERLKREA